MQNSQDRAPLSRGFACRLPTLSGRWAAAVFLLPLWKALIIPASPQGSPQAWAAQPPRAAEPVHVQRQLHSHSTLPALVTASQRSESFSARAVVLQCVRHHLRSARHWGKRRPWEGSSVTKTCDSSRCTEGRISEMCSVKKVLESRLQSEDQAFGKGPVLLGVAYTQPKSARGVVLTDINQKQSEF